MQDFSTATVAHDASGKPLTIADLAAIVRVDRGMPADGFVREYDAEGFVTSTRFAAWR